VQALGLLPGRRCTLVAAAVALAAQAVREAALPGVEEALVRAYASLHGEDPGCRARLALLEALDHMEATDDAPFVHAARYVQLEKAWGAPVDTAAGGAAGVAVGTRISYLGRSVACS